MTDGPSIRMYEPAEVGLSQAALDRLLPYAESIVGELRVPNGSEASTLQAAPSCAAPPPLSSAAPPSAAACLRPRRVSAPADARARAKTVLKAPHRYMARIAQNRECGNIGVNATHAGAAG